MRLNIFSGFSGYMKEGKNGNTGLHILSWEVNMWTNPKIEESAAQKWVWTTLKKGDLSLLPLQTFDRIFPCILVWNCIPQINIVLLIKLSL